MSAQSVLDSPVPLRKRPRIKNEDESDDQPHSLRFSEVRPDTDGRTAGPSCGSQDSRAANGSRNDDDLPIKQEPTDQELPPTTPFPATANGTDLEAGMPPIKFKPAEIEERKGIIRTQVVENDNSRDSNILLTGLKNIFQKQLPKMPKEYIARLVYDKCHGSMAIVKGDYNVVGGITYRLFNSRGFAEIVFCAISSSEQVQGYGSFLMSSLKDYMLEHTQVRHFLTYADNYAIGYFKKQGFKKEISLDKPIWMGYIKDYEGGTLMQCSMYEEVRYRALSRDLALQKWIAQQKTARMSRSHVVYPGLECFRAAAAADQGSDQSPSTRQRSAGAGAVVIDPYSIRGVKESGWTQEMDLQVKKPVANNRMAIQRRIVSDLQNHNQAWSFMNPVNSDEVPDYYSVIKEPMDLSTLEANVESEMYPTMREFAKDVQKIFDNCRRYNAENTIYYKCATKLEKYFKEKLKEYSATLKDK
ncbi:histone acetyltransferase [Tieghemiomyces parasiticus]|uniref:histone acetyltransferase n=1 Tax=Tieghemiomyces parasiticus TaxID=78921 RepID=A0A9W8AE33_9FUNG|nr:histone acetyltransferase [Tieghemiomyces parasiticus]